MHIEHSHDLATVQILYRFPDHPTLIAHPFIWQDYDSLPGFPNVTRFLLMWQTKVEGPLHDVRVMFKGRVYKYSINKLKNLH